MRCCTSTAHAGHRFLMVSRVQGLKYHQFCHKLLYQLYAKFPCRLTYQLYEPHLGSYQHFRSPRFFLVEWWKHQATDCHTRFHLDLSLCINLSDISHLGNSLRILLAEPCGSGFRSEEESPGSFSLKLDKSGVRINRVSWTENTS